MRLQRLLTEFWCGEGDGPGAEVRTALPWQSRGQKTADIFSLNLIFFSREDFKIILVSSDSQKPRPKRLLDLSCSSLCPRVHLMRGFRFF